MNVEETIKVLEEEERELQESYMRFNKTYKDIQDKLDRLIEK